MLAKPKWRDTEGHGLMGQEPSPKKLELHHDHYYPFRVSYGYSRMACCLRSFCQSELLQAMSTDGSNTSGGWRT